MKLVQATRMVVTSAPIDSLVKYAGQKTMGARSQIVYSEIDEGRQS